ncbi:solute carrier family 2, facilitated glucose transporter member 8-like [Homalodisca vitripennis]|uniref:solute carrier family 2, facilitated glucose transporter member 8-like n=1 Tax=Homalodisca vitripennis TaxID=197043 RepID=UPI001EECAD0B|nr:solute carrier family 2, facilitated glucose transporter member 8-like [Homalodisca vitripennis]
MRKLDHETARYQRVAKIRQFTVVSLVSLLGFCTGTTLGWTSPMQPLLMSRDSPVGTEPMTEDKVAWLGSINFLGTAIGTFFWGTIADRLGRKNIACISTVPYILNWTLILAAQNFWILMAARFIAGIANNGASMAASAFISEVAQDDLRGFFGSFFIIFVNFGILYSYVIGTYFKYYALSIACLMVPIIFLLTFFWVPETPMFLWKNGQTVKAEQSVFWYRGGDAAETERVLLKYKSTPSNIKKKLSFMSLFATRGTTKGFILGMALMIALQTSGILPVLSFAVSIFEICGASLTPYQSALIIGLVQVIFTCLSSLLVDKLGRKFLLISSLLTMSLSLLVLGAYLFFLSTQPVASLLRWIPVISLSLFVSAYSIGVGPIPFIVVGEIFPTHLKGLAISYLLLGLGLTAFIFVKLFPIMKTLLQPYGCFWAYSVFCSLFSMFFYAYLPETKGKPQSEILNILNNGSVNEIGVENEQDRLNKTEIK